MKNELVKLFNDYKKSQAKYEADRSELIEAVNKALEGKLTLKVSEVPKLEVREENLIMHYTYVDYDESEPREVIL